MYMYIYIASYCDVIHLPDLHPQYLNSSYKLSTVLQDTFYCCPKPKHNSTTVMPGCMSRDACNYYNSTYNKVYYTGVCYVATHVYNYWSVVGSGRGSKTGTDRYMLGAGPGNKAEGGA